MTNVNISNETTAAVEPVRAVPVGTTNVDQRRNEIARIVYNIGNTAPSPSGNQIPSTRPNIRRPFPGRTFSCDDEN